MSKEYSDLLKDPRWQKLRALAMNRDNFTCQECGATDKTLHVHHKKYTGRPWDAPLDDLVTLCEDCHKKAHNIIERKCTCLWLLYEDRLRRPYRLRFTSLVRKEDLPEELQRMIAEYGPLAF